MGLILYISSDASIFGNADNAFDFTKLIVPGDGAGFKHIIDQVLRRFSIY